MILAALKAKVACLQEELKVQEKASSAEVFETDDPQYNQHVVSHIYVSKYNTGAHNVYPVQFASNTVPRRRYDWSKTFIYVCQRRR